ncbi:LOW QUALITY PROTEIN: armadillo repeat-containing protein 7, partial [Mantella aurantiaca]
MRGRVLPYYFSCLSSAEAREQILANLGNFSYDPRNLCDLRKLRIPDLFLDMLSEDNENLVEFGIGGLCNMCLDDVTRSLIVSSGGLSLVMNCLSSRREETLLSAMTTLLFLGSEVTCPEVTRSPPIIECMTRLSLSQNPRISNLANVFLQDLCTDHRAMEPLSHHSANIT